MCCMDVGDQEVPQRISQLERACTILCARLVRESWSPEICLPNSKPDCAIRRASTWTRHLAEIAWELRDVERLLAPLKLQDSPHSTSTSDRLQRRSNATTAFLNWSDWHDCEWYCGSRHCPFPCPATKSTCRVGSGPQCAPLPLSVWDAEENYEAFNTAERVVQHWFLVALHGDP